MEIIIIIKTWEERAIGTQPPAFQTSWEVLKAQRGEAGKRRQVLSASEQSLILTQHSPSLKHGWKTEE